jgi:ribosomal protein L11 methyltransferase
MLCTHLPPGRPPPAEQVLWLKSQEAFPAGHPTTRLCLDLLRQAVAAQAVGRVLDLGCGVGVLSLAAAALGASRVLGIDISRKAALATRENTRENALAGLISVAQGSSECLKGPFDLVLANLPWEVQMDKVTELDRLAAPQGRLILSGFRDNQEDPLIESYLDLGWAVNQRLAKPFRHPELPADLSFTWVAWLLQ